LQDVADELRTSLGDAAVGTSSVSECGVDRPDAPFVEIHDWRGADIAIDALAATLRKWEIGDVVEVRVAPVGVACD
jgi:hypothetical protein